MGEEEKVGLLKKDKSLEAEKFKSMSKWGVIKKSED